jgi:CHAD domain-containing protein
VNCPDVFLNWIEQRALRRGVGCRPHGGLRSIKGYGLLALRTALCSRQTQRMPTITRERKTSYDVTSNFTVPDLAAVSGLVSSIVEEDVLELRSTYYDTVRRDLSRNGITLRHRQGAVDAGWQLKLPDSGLRTEIGLPDSAGTVPAAMRELVDGVRHGRRLHPVAVLRIRRCVQRLMASDGSVLAIVSDDEVTADAANPIVHGQMWREVEVEDGAGGDGRILAAIDGRLTESGAQLTDRPSKLTHVLDAYLPGGESRKRARSMSTVGALAGDYLAAHVTALILGDVALRAGRPAVHDAQVATRRLRSTLRVFGLLWEEDRVAALDQELAWLAALLGAVRDREILAQRLCSELGSLSNTVGSEPAGQLINERLAAETAECRAELLQAMHGHRYRALLADLNDFVLAPPTSALADEHPHAVLAYVRSAERVATKRLRQATLPGADDSAMHRAGQAARRARYAVELARPVLGAGLGKARIGNLAAAQKLLGEYRDAMLTAHFLSTLGVAHREGFGLGALWAAEQQHATQTRTAVTDVAR